MNKTSVPNTAFKTPAWAEEGKSDSYPSLKPNGNPCLIWSTDYLVDADLAAAVTREDEFDIASGVAIAGEVKLTVFVPDEPIEFTDPDAVRRLARNLLEAADQLEHLR
jgi:hypothetical protein